LSARHSWRFIIGPLAVVLLLVITNLPAPAIAQACGQTPTPPNCAEQRRLRAQVNSYEVQAVVDDLGVDRGFRVSLMARLEKPGGGENTVPRPPSPGWHAPGAGPNPSDVLRVYCRRDDYAFLPPQSVGGLPCDQPTRGHARDPQAIAEGMWDQLPLPVLRLGMNPQPGLVAVPTWFWADGYDGDLLPLADTLLLPNEVCHQAVDRDARGDVVLDGQGHPSTHRECQTIWDSLSVEVVAWPDHYVWDFGDRQTAPIGCQGIAACPDGLGRPYTDPRSPSPIAHAYTWTSLGQSGPLDAYTVTLSIHFLAHYRFSLNGQSLSGWQPLRPRELAVSASHQVREAQAVLTKP